MYDFRKQGVDYQKVFLLMLKWPVYAFKLLRRGRFETIAELRRDAYRLDKMYNPKKDAFAKARSDSSPDLFKGITTTIASPRTAVGWSVFCILLLLIDHYVLIPQLRGMLAILLVAASFLTILVMLSSIVRERSEQQQQQQFDGSKEGGGPSFGISNVLGGAFFLVSTVPFALPWVIAFFFPRQCILFFTTWAILGAVIGEVSVLVSQARIDARLQQAKKDRLEAQRHDEDTSQQDMSKASTTNVPRKRKRKSTELRIATMTNFDLDDRRDLEDYLTSDEGLKWWAAFLAMQGCISGAAVFLRLVVDVFFDDNALVKSILLLLSLSMFCESFWMTYAAGGRWLHFRKLWRFFQPFKGGRRFILFQVPAWFLFFVFMFKTVSDIGPAFHLAFEQLEDPEGKTGTALYVLDFMFSASTFVCNIMGMNSWLSYGHLAIWGSLAELFLLVSLPMFEGQENSHYLETVLDTALLDMLSDESSSKTPPVAIVAKSEEELAYEEIKENLSKQQRRIRQSAFSISFWEMCTDALRTAWLSPIVLTLVKPEVTLFLTGFLLTKYVHGASFFNLFTIYLPYLVIPIELAYLPTYAGNPRRTGHRRWWNGRGSWWYNELSAYWYTNIIRERELNGNCRHIFGYEPHGLFPMGSMYVANTTQWMNLFPDIVPFTLTATITHIVPMLRDVTQFNGGLEVTQESFSHALMEFKNVMLVPGGQHEMLLFSPDPQEILLSSKHKGFIKLALEAARDNPEETINLVPIYAFGEPEMLSNAFPASLSLQRWLVAKLRFNPAFLPAGRFNLAGVPRRVPITFCVGSPQTVPVIKFGPTEKQVELLADRYYSAVEETFERHKAIVGGFETSRVTFVPPLANGLLSKEEFERKWMELERIEGADAELQERLKNAPKRTKKDTIPYPEYLVAMILTNVCLWTPYFFFA